MRRALIGHSGFVGSNLKADGGFSDLYNSANIREMAGERFDEVVCAGVSAVKWLANKEPENDWRAIERLLDVLARVDAGRFTLISTIDVYPKADRPDDEATVLDLEDGQPYGRHRLQVERFVGERFRNVLVARLPALFGPGLRKNVVFDLLAGNQTEKINPASAFQWYPLERLARDLATAWGAGLSLVNLFPEPLETRRVLDELFAGATVGPTAQPAPRYDLRTRHAELFGGANGFVMSADEVMEALSRFVGEARAKPVEALK